MPDTAVARGTDLHFMYTGQYHRTHFDVTIYTTHIRDNMSSKLWVEIDDTDNQIYVPILLNCVTAIKRTTNISLKILILLFLLIQLRIYLNHAQGFVAFCGGPVIDFSRMRCFIYL